MIRTRPKVSVGSLLRLAGTWILGVGAGGAALVAAFVLGASAESARVFWAAFACLTMIPTMLLWASRRRYPRMSALGIATVFVCLNYVAFVWRPWSTMDPEEIAHAEAEAIKSGHPAFYLGRDVQGLQLNGYELYETESAFLYGAPCHPLSDDFDCPWDVEVYTWWTDVTIGGDDIAGCFLLDESIAGVPTVHQYHAELGYDDILLFTADSRITIDVEAKSSLEDKLRIARAIRPVGATGPATSLPPPEPEILGFLEEHCVPAS